MQVVIIWLEIRLKPLQTRGVLGMQERGGGVQAKGVRFLPKMD